MKKIGKWILPLSVVALFVFMAALFLTPSFTQKCTEKLLVCVEAGLDKGFLERILAHLGCVYHNVICVLGGLFI